MYCQNEGHWYGSHDTQKTGDLKIVTPQVDCENSDVARKDNGSANNATILQGRNFNDIQHRSG